MHKPWKTLPDLLLHHAAHSDAWAIFYRWVGGRWDGWSLRRLIDGVHQFCSYFEDLGIGEGEYIAVVPERGRVEWMMLYMACWVRGIRVMIMQPHFSEATVGRWLRVFRMKIVLVDHEGLYYKLRDVCGDTPLYHLDWSRPHFFPLLERINQRRSGRHRRLLVHAQPDDIACILFSSGTSGEPKAVALTHRNLLSNVEDLVGLLPLDPRHRVLSYLPFSHIFEHTACLCYLAMGCKVYFSSSQGDLLRDMREVRPHFITAVPRVLEKVLEYAETKIHGQPFYKRWLWRRAKKVALRYGIAKGWPYVLQLKILRYLVFRRWRRIAGGSLQWIGVGAAHLDSNMHRMFEAAGIKIRVGYGMTEASPVISFQRFDRPPKYGSVGLPLPSVEVSIVPIGDGIEGEGEIVVRGPNICKGYLREDGATSDEGRWDAKGWFHTEDLGYLDNEGYLYLTGRLSEVYKTSSGKFVHPHVVEALLRRSPWVEEALYIGANRPYPTVLIRPNFCEIQNYFDKIGEQWTSEAYVIHHLKVQERFEEIIHGVNSELPSHMRIRNFCLCHESWGIETGERTISQKLRRKHLMGKYQKQIDRMYPKYT